MYQNSKNFVKYAFYSLFFLFSLSQAQGSKYIVAGSQSGKMQVWSAKTFELITEFKGYDKGINSIVASADGKIIITGSNETIRVWLTETWECCNILNTDELNKHEKAITAIALSPDKEFIASGSKDCTVKLWSAATGKYLYTLRGYDDRIVSLDFSPKDQIIATASKDNKVKIRSLKELESGKTIKTIKLHNSRYGNKIKFDPDGNLLAIMEDNTIIIISTANWECKKVLDVGHELTDINFSPQGDILVSTGWNGEILLWSMEDFTCVGKENKFNRGMTCAYSHNGEQILLSIFEDIAIFDKELKPITEFKRDTSWGECVIFVPEEEKDPDEAERVLSVRQDEFAKVDGEDFTVNLFNLQITGLSKRFYLM